MGEASKKGCGCLPIAGGIGIGIVVLFIIFLIITPSDNSENNEGYSGTTVIDDNRTYEKSWRLPTAGYEYTTFGKIIVKNGIKVCGEYYVKEVANDEFVIACTADGYIWHYFVIYPTIDKIYRANEEMELKLKPPR